MVFANLPSHEKDAFFNLLDEYFSSRPDLFGSASNAAGPGAAASSVLNSDAGRAAATSAFNHFKSHPQETASTISALRKAAAPPPSSQPSQSSASTADSGSSVGRVAAAAAAFGSAGLRPPPGRTQNSGDSETNRSSTSLASQKKFGDVDVSSGKAMFTSLRGSTAAKSATPPQVASPTPPAFAARMNNYGPPPVRRLDSTTSVPVNRTPSPQPPAPPPPPARPRQEEPEGEWAEALYDYASEDPGDLPIEEGQRVFIVERTSDDWWTGEVEGRRGLVPATYVKVL